MVASSFFLATALLSLVHGAPINKAPRSLVERAAGASYRIFGGDGTTATGWPSEDQWLSFDELWELNLPIMKSSCSQFGTADNSDAEIQDIKDGLDAAASASGVKKEFIFAIMMQESKGCVRAPTTNWGVRNPGLMQDHDGKHTCNEGGAQNPCPKDQIFGMINDGASGTAAGDGLKQTLAHAGANDVSKYYRAARIYNSGRVDASGNLGGGIATHCYASDIANRLIGWSSDSTRCQEGSIGGVQMSEGGGNSNPNPKPSSKVVAQPTATPTQTPDTPKPTITGTPATTTTANPQPTHTPDENNGGHHDGNDNNPNDIPDNNTPNTPATPDNKAPGAPATCSKWYTVQKDDYCQKIEQSQGVAQGTIAQLNSGVGTDCLNLWLGYSYCLAA